MRNVQTNEIPKAPIFAINRLRMGTDGPGVTTLVAFMGCPLKCKYCLNPQCHQPIYEEDRTTLRDGVMMLTPQELYDMVKIDNIYFQATGGGICFGGGEPTLYPQFIEEFKNLCGNRWKITIETSGYCSYRTYKILSNIVDYWIVDVKSIDSSIYKENTGHISGVLQHLYCLKGLVDDKSKVTIKVPYIPGFNDNDDIDKDIEKIKKRYGFMNVVKTKYIIK